MCSNQSLGKDSISFHKLVGMDPIPSYVADLKELKISFQKNEDARIAAYAFYVFFC